MKMKLLNWMALITLVTASCVHGADPQTFAGQMLKSVACEGPDRVQNDVAGPGWFWNLGPTGIRAMLVDKQGKCEWQGTATCFRVKYVFDKSPATGKILPEDLIVGINGRKFKTSYTLGYWFGIGYDGPPMEFGEGIEESEKSKNGNLDIMVVRKDKPLTVTVTIASKGAFSPTFPFDCKKSERLLQEAVAYLVKEQGPDGRWAGNADVNVDAALALLAQGPKYRPHVERNLKSSLKNIDKNTWNWDVALYAILASEYTLATTDKRFMAQMTQLDKQLQANQTPNHTYGHMGYAVRDPGFYGPMAGLTALTCLSRIMMEKSGVPVRGDEIDQTMIELDMLEAQKTPENHLGYPYGWGDYKAPAKLDASKIRKGLSSIPDAPLKERSTQAGGIFPSGCIALIHTFRPWKDYSPKIVKANLNAITRTPGAVVNGHGSGYIHAMWGSLAVGSQSLGEGKNDRFRLLMDYHKAYLNLARCHDGTFYTQPTRDDMNGDYGRSTRTLPTAVVALMLSVPKRSLLILGRKGVAGSDEYQAACSLLETSDESPEIKEIHHQKAVVLLKYAAQQGIPAATRTLGDLSRKKESMDVSKVPAFALTAREGRDVRTWRSQNGKTVTAALVSMDGGKMQLKTESGESVEWARQTLSKEDLQYIDTVRLNEYIQDSVPADTKNAPAGSGGASSNTKSE